MKKRHPNNIGIRHNPDNGLYEIGEKGITYAMPMELTTPLKEYFRYYTTGGNDERTVADWYRRLSREEKRKVVRSGDVREEDNGFRADAPHWED